MDGKTRSLDRSGLATVLSLSVLWGVNPVVLKAALAEVDPFTLSAICCAIGCLLLLVYAGLRKPEIFRIDGTEALGGLAALLLMGQFLAVFESLRWTTLSHSIVFLYCAPLFVALGTTFVLKDDSLRPLQWVGLGLAFAGMVSEFVRRWGVSHPAGDAMAVLAGLLWASTTLLIKGSRLARIDPAKVLLYQIGLTAVLCAAGAWAMGERAPKNLSLSTYAALLWQGGVIVGLTYAIWIWLVGRYAVAQLTAFGFVTPLVGVAAAGVVVGEPLTRDLAWATALVLAGLILISWPRRAAFPAAERNPG